MSSRQSDAVPEFWRGALEVAPAPLDWRHTMIDAFIAMAWDAHKHTHPDLFPEVRPFVAVPKSVYDKHFAR